MDRVEYSKCKECQKVRHVAELKEHENADGKVCIDVDACRARKLEKQSR